MYIIIPGLRNSAENHWQSIWEREHPELFFRVQQLNWDEPDCTEWIEQMERQLAAYQKEELILIGHSIGCMAIIHWLKRFGHTVKGILLVAPSDAERPGFPAYISGFSPLPLTPLTIPGIVVASTNDHVTTFDRAKFFAECWHCELITLNEAGHIEPKSGFCNWEEGKSILGKLNGPVLTHSFQ